MIADNTSSPLKVGIIGAGIAGLGAAIALCRAGHHVEIYEKSSFKNEIGAAITMSPNANKILSNWGFDAVEARETLKGQMRLLDPKTLKTNVHVDYADITERFDGHKFNAFHRVDMHEQLRRIAEQAGTQIRLGNGAVDLDCERGFITFADGSTVEKDLVVVADGFRSQFITNILQQDITTHKMGKSVYRTLIPMSDLMADPLVRPIFENELSGFVSSQQPSHGVMLVSYPCRDDEIMNVAIFHTTKPQDMDKEDWNSPADMDDVLDLLSGDDVHPAWRSFIQHADKIHCYNLGMRDTIPRMNRGKVVMIGDAAHPMQPTHAQGGCMALEDAAAFEVLFSSSNFSPEKGDSVELRLDLYNKLRLPRNNTTQLLSNSMFYSRLFGTEVSEKIKQYYSGALIPPTALPWDRSIQDFFFWYDTYVQANRSLEWKDKPDQMPENAVTHFGVENGGKMCKS